ncbi:GNAT family N-acetyltransferase [Micromonospora sp. WMMD1082]|uniref:GNAT family N-acetyltransferase n=1 Tax=Micromonospora sp. WMMD1082 TaxID=3016104 RepID=UPI0024179FD4|nr:GNAT family N-acetyltransferase [Micromonospora sp. WMMD1082]MDG4795166.1 GNAT family N-acetyltransferase [Micromonospora sp. WMMD1082]
MSNEAPGTTTRRHDGIAVDGLLDTLTAVWADAHADDHDVAAAGFNSDTLRRQIIGHATRDDFTLITAHNAERCIGFGYGFRCSPAYWFGKDLLPSITEAARTTDSLIGICELAVCRRWHGHGVGSRIHAAILDALGPQWASLLTMPNSNAQRFYRRLGYRYAGPYRTNPNGPVLDLLLLRSFSRNPTP